MCVSFSLSLFFYFKKEGWGWGEKKRQQQTNSGEKIDRHIASNYSLTSSQNKSKTAMGLESFCNQQGNAADYFISTPIFLDILGSFSKIGLLTDGGEKVTYT